MLNLEPRGAIPVVFFSTLDAVAEQPVEILRTLSSFEPGIVGAVYVLDPQGEELTEARVC